MNTTNTGAGSDARMTRGLEQRIQYNFVKPHGALDGQTPAQAAGIGIEGENKWMELLKKAIDRKPAP